MDAADVHILSVGTALPGPAVDNGMLARRFGMEPLWEQWIDIFIGTSTRHLAVDLESGEVRSSLAELGELAARRALATADLAPDDVDVVVLGTSTPDALMPATVNVVADALGINHVPTYQLQSGCAGAVQALDVGRRMLGGGARHALVIAGDVCAKHYDLTADLKSLPPAELVNAVLFGDGAGAAVLTADAVTDSAAIRYVVNELCGLGRAPGQVVEWFGLADRDAARAPVKEDYKAIEESVPTMAREILTTMLDALGWAPTDVDFMLPPQLSGRMTEKIMAELDMPMAVEITCVSETGNTGNALPFLQLERALGKMSYGDRALAIAVESSKWIKAGFAIEKI
jgi:3-oxoacyl-[acyl-carrier-protein] synthase-3